MPARMVPQVSGRVVDSPDGITVQEVPTDGTAASFPSAGGNIPTMRSVPGASEAQPKQPSRLDIIGNRLSELFGVVERMGQVIDMVKGLSGAEKSRLGAEYHGSAIDAMGNGRRYGYGGQGGNTGGRQGYRESCIMDGNGGGEGRMGYRNQYGNFPANPKNRRRMRRGGYGEEPIGNIRQMVEDADPGRKRQLERDLEGLMPEMWHEAGPRRRRRPATNR